MNSSACTARRTAHATLAALAIALVPGVRSIYAAPVSALAAKTEAAAWLAKRNTIAGQDISRRPASGVRSLKDKAGGELFHVVELDGGGYVVVAADDSAGSVIAFSGTGTFLEDDRNPLLAMLRRDLPARLENAKEATRLKTGGAVKDKSVIAKKQSAPTKLDTSATVVKTGASSVDDIRVAPILASKWDQTTVAGKRVYNYHTPSAMPCGCVATAAAQIMRHHEFPMREVDVAEYSCEVGGRARTLTTIGGTYDWTLMPLMPDSSIDDAEREMIGRLCYDVGVVSCMSYASGGSGAIAYHTAEGLRDLFGYTQAVYVEQFYGNKDGVMEQIENSMLANLDAGCPVMMGISGKDVSTRQSIGHEIVGDGYGYIDGNLYVHLNLGWSGSWDAWYNLPNIDTYSGRSGYNFTLFDDMVYNIFPEDDLEIISGRVLDESARSLEGVRVYAIDDNGNNIAEAVSSQYGVYALKVPANGKYKICAELGSLASGERTVEVGESTTYSTYFGETRAASFADSVGNRWGIDVPIKAGTCAAPVFSPASCTFIDALKITCSQSDTEAVVRYTTDGSDPDEDSVAWPAGGIEIDRSTTLKARAFRAGMADSPVAVATYVDRPQPALSGEKLVWKRPAGAAFFKVYRADNRFGMEPDECSGWISEKEFAVELPESAREPVFYFVRAAASPDDAWESPLSGAVAVKTSADGQSGEDTQVFTFLGVSGGTNEAFRISDFPVIVPSVHCATEGAFGDGGYFKVNVPSTNRKNVSIPENTEDETIKTTKIISSTKFAEAWGTVSVGDNSAGAASRSWKASLWFVQGGQTNYAARSSVSASPTWFHYFQQCSASLAVDADGCQVDAGATNSSFRVNCPREYEWTAKCDSDWVKLRRTHAAGPCPVRFSVEANDGIRKRSATVMVECGAIRRTFTVEQDGRDDSVDYPEIADEVYATASRGAKTSSVFLLWNAVKGALEYRIYRTTGDDKMAASPYWVSTNSIPALIDLEVEPGVVYRYSVTAITAAGRTNPSPEVYGWAAPTVKTDTAGIEFDSTNSCHRIVVLSNAGWSFDTDAEWITCAAIDAERNGVLDVTVEENPYAKERTATLVLIGGAGTPFPATNFVSIVQASAPAGSIAASHQAKSSGSGIAASQSGDEDADPTLSVSIAFENGELLVTLHSSLPVEERKKRVYTLWGKASLRNDSQWRDMETLDDASRRSMRFFKATATWR